MDDPSSLVQITLAESGVTGTILTTSEEYDLSSRGSALVLAHNPFSANLPFSFLEDDSERLEAVVFTDGDEIGPAPAQSNIRSRRGK